MLKFLRIAFIVVLMLCFLVSCKHRQRETSAVLKTASQAPKQKSRASAPAPSKGNQQEEKLREALGLTSKDVKAPLYRFVLDWYGVPYRYGGCQKSGVDCSCFASVLSERVYGKTLPRQASDIFRSCRELSIKDAREGDLLFFKIGSTKITHVGVYLRNNWFVHASTSRGVIVSSVKEAYYKKYFYCAGRMKDA